MQLEKHCSCAHHLKKVVEAKEKKNIKNVKDLMLKCINVAYQLQSSEFNVKIKILFTTCIF